MSRRAPVTEVTNAEEVANLRWYEQGDMQLQTPEMLEKRAALRQDKVVLRELNVWWDAALKGSFAAAAAGRRQMSRELDFDLEEVDGGEQSPAINKSRYVAIMTKMALALLEDDEPKDIQEARKQARESWSEDAGERATLSRKRWLDSIFELADTWTESVDNVEYAMFLRALFDRTARKEAAGELGCEMIYWLEDEEVVPLPAPLVVHAIVNSFDDDDLVYTDVVNTLGARSGASARAGSQAGSSASKRAGKIEAISAAGARGAKGGCALARPISSYANRGGAGGRSSGSSSNGGSGQQPKAAAAPAALRDDVERAAAAGASSLLALPNEQRRAIRDKEHVARQVGMRLWRSSMLIQAMFIAKLRTRQLRRAREAASTVQSHVRGNLARRALGKAIGGGDASSKVSSNDGALDAARMAMRDRAQATHSLVPLQKRRSASPQYRLTSESPTLSPVSSSMNMGIEGIGAEVFVASVPSLPPSPNQHQRSRILSPLATSTIHWFRSTSGEPFPALWIDPPMVHQPGAEHCSVSPPLSRSPRPLSRLSSRPGITGSRVTGNEDSPLGSPLNTAPLGSPLNTAPLGSPLNGSSQLPTRLSSRLSSRSVPRFPSRVPAAVRPSTPQSSSLLPPPNLPPHRPLRSSSSAPDMSSYGRRPGRDPAAIRPTAMAMLIGAQIKLTHSLNGARRRHSALQACSPPPPPRCSSPSPPTLLTALSSSPPRLTIVQPLQLPFDTSSSFVIPQERVGLWGSPGPLAFACVSSVSPTYSLPLRPRVPRVTCQATCRTRGSRAAGSHARAHSGERLPSVPLHGGHGGALEHVRTPEAEGFEDGSSDLLSELPRPSTTTIDRTTEFLAHQTDEEVVALALALRDATDALVTKAYAGAGFDAGYGEELLAGISHVLAWLQRQ